MNERPTLEVVKFHPSGRMTRKVLSEGHQFIGCGLSDGEAPTLTVHAPQDKYNAHFKLVMSVDEAERVASSLLEYAQRARERSKNASSVKEAGGAYHDR